MFFIVIGINLSIALIALFAAWKVWQLRRTLAGIRRGIDGAERGTYNVLHGAPTAILQGQKGARQARQQIDQLSPQLQRLQQLLGLLRLGQRTWQQQSRLSKGSKRIS